jgi:hypothetical protein
MAGWKTVAASLSGSLALVVPGAAGSAPAPAAATAVVLRSSGGFVSRRDVVWYTAAGAQMSVRRDERGGHFRASVPFAQVQRIVAEADLCSRSTAAPARAAMDVPVYHLSVHCGNGTWAFFTTYGPYEWHGEPHVRSAVIALTRLADALDWRTENSDALPPDDGLLPVTPRPTIIPSPSVAPTTPITRTTPVIPS